jgi:repressor LexA
MFTIIDYKRRCNMGEREYRLTKRQRRMLHFIWDFAQERGYPPSIREIGRAVDISSTSVVNYNLERLEQEGLIERDRGQSRGLRLSDTGLDFLSVRPEGVISVPFLGVIAAGEPIPIPASDFSLTGADETVELAQGILRDTGDLYALRVQGNSMIDALINDGDIVVMRHAETVESGEMAAVWLRDEEETTLKRVYWEKGRIRLQPANPTMDPIYVDNPEQVEVRGKVVMVIRNLQRQPAVP